MESGGLAGDIYKPLSADQVSMIHKRAFDLLEDSGMTYEEGLGRPDIYTDKLKAADFMNRSQS